MGVYNADANDVCYEIVASERVGPVPIPLTNGVAYSNTVVCVSNAVPDGIDYFTYEVSPNAARVTFDVFDLSDDVDLVVTTNLPLPTLTAYDDGSFNLNLEPEEVMLTTNAGFLPPTAGTYYIGVTHYGLTNCPLTYTVIATEYTNDVIITPLPSGVPQAGVLAGPSVVASGFSANLTMSLLSAAPPSQTVSNSPAYYSFNVATNALQANFEILDADGDVDLYIKPGLPLPATNLFAYASTNTGSADEFIAVATNSTPTALRPGPWYLTVINPNTNVVHFNVKVTQFIEGTNVTRLSNSVPYTNLIASTNGPIPDGSDYYIFTVTTNATWVSFDLLEPSDNVELAVHRATLLPRLDYYDYLSANPGTNEEQVLVFTNSIPAPLAAGDWFLSVIRSGLTNQTNLTYTVVATEFTNEPPGFTTLTNAQPYETTVAGLSNQFYRFTVSSNAVQANFELLNPAGNVDLFIRPILPFTNPHSYVYASTNAGVANEFIAVATNSVPVPLGFGEWYLLVQNRETNAVTYTVRVTEFVPDTPGLVVLTNAVPYTRSHTNDAGPISAGTDYYLFNVPTGAIWAVFDLFDASADVSLLVRKELPLPTPANYDYRSANPSPADEQVLVITNSVPVPLAPGAWHLGVRHGDLAESNLTYTVRATVYSNAPPVVIGLTNAIEYAATIPVGSTHYYQFTVSTNAVQANFELLGLTGDADLFVRPGSSLPGTNNFTYASTNLGTNAEFIAVATNSLPVPLTPGDWFIAVVNQDTNSVDYRLQATGFVPDTPLLVNLTNGVPVFHTVAAGTGEFNHRTDYYLFIVPSNATWAQFEFLIAQLPVDLVVRRELLLPTLANFDYQSINPDGTNQQVLVITNSTPVPLAPGAWFIGVPHRDVVTNDASYVLFARAFTTPPPLITPLTNTVALATNVPGNGTRYFQFTVSTNAVEAHFELRDLTGNVDLYLRPGSSTPGTNNFVYASTNLDTNAEFIAVATNSAPVPLTPGGWFMAVVNQESTNVDFTIQATEYVPETPTLVQLTNNLPFTQVMTPDAAEFNRRTDYFRFNVESNHNWARFEVLGADTPVDLVLRSQVPLPTLATYDYLSANLGTNNEQIVVITNSSPVPLAPGAWYLGVVRLEPITNDITYTVLASAAAEPPVITALSNTVVVVTNVPANEAQYYQFTVSSNAVEAHFELAELSGNADLFIRPGSSLPSEVNFAYASMNLGTNAEFIAVATNSTPFPLTPGDWSIAVVNLETNLVNYTIQVTEYVPETPTLLALTNGVDYTNTVLSGTGEFNHRTDFYLFNVESNHSWATFEVLAPEAPVDLVVRRELPLPSLADYDYRSINPGLLDEQVLVVTNSTPVPLEAGAWYLGVVRLTPATTNQTYTVRATAFTNEPPAVTVLSNAVAIATNAPDFGPQYYRFNVPTNAVEAHFELLGLTGNVDLFVRPGSSLPSPANYAYASTNAGTNAEFIATATNSLPVPLSAGDWFLTVWNQESNHVDYIVQATAFVPDTPTLPTLTNAEPRPNVVQAGDGEFNQRTDYYVFNVESNANWVLFEVLNPDAPVDLVVRREVPLPTLADYDYRSINLSTNEEQVLVLTNSTPVPLSPGPWYVGVVRLTAAVSNNVSYVVQATAFTNETPIITELTNAVALSTNAPAEGVQFYQFNVSADAVQANFEIQGLTGDVDLYVRPGSSLPGTNNFVYASTNLGFSPEFIAVATNSLPVPLTPGGWFLAVVNREADAVDYTIQVTEFVPDTPTLLTLTNTVPFTNTVTAGTGEFNQRTDYYLFNVASNDVWATFEVFGADAPVDLVLRREVPLPTLAEYDYLSANEGTNDEQVLLLTNTLPVPLASGPWYLGVVRLTPATNDITYVVRASASAAGAPAITVLTNAVPLTNNVSSPGTNYYQFSVSSNTVQANFELLALTGNVDLYLRSISSLPGPKNYTYASTNTGTNGEFIAVATNSLPVPLTAGEWFLAVVNQDTGAVDYAIQATEFVPGTPTLVELTNGVLYTTNILAGTGEFNHRTDYYLFNVESNATWVSFDMLFASQPVDMSLSRNVPLPTLTDSDYLSDNPGLAAEQLLVITNSRPVPLAPGPWYVGVTRLEYATNDLFYLLSVTAFTSAPPALTVLSNAVALAANISVGATQYYQFAVSRGAVQANFEILDPSGDVDLFLKRGFPLPGTSVYDYAGTNAGPASEFIRVTNNFDSTTLKPGNWFLAVVNRETAPVDYWVRATEFVPGTPTLRRLADGEPYHFRRVNTGLPTGGGVEYYVFEVSSNATWVTFDVRNPSANVDLVLRRELPLPTPTEYDQHSVNPGTNDEQVLLITNDVRFALEPGDWYLGVTHAELTGGLLQYTVQATEFTNAPPVITTLTNAVQLTSQVDVGDPKYYLFIVSSNAVQANFEVRNYFGNADLFIKPGLPLPDQLTYAYASTNAGTNSEFIAVATNSMPIALTPGPWTLAVVDADPALPAISSVRVTEFVPGATNLFVLTNAMPFTKTVAPGPGVFDDRIEYFAFDVPTNASYVSFDLLQPTDNVDLMVSHSVPLPRPYEFDYRNANPGTNDEQVLVATNSTPVPLTPGLWFLGVIHDTAPTNTETYTVLATVFTNEPPTIVTLTNGRPFSGTFEVAGTNYYKFVMPSNAIQADFEVTGMSSNLDLFIRPWLPLPSLTNHAYASTNAGQADEAIHVTTNSTPVPLAPGDWYLAVLNTNAASVIYSVKVSAYPPLIPLTNGVPVTNTIAEGTNAVPDGFDYYVFQVSSNSTWATFEVLQPSANVDLLVTRGLPFPERDHFDYRSINPGTNDEQVLVITNSVPVPLAPGNWYLGVTHFGLTETNLSYTVRATEFTSAPPVIVTVTNDFPVTNITIAALETNYYKFEVSADAVQANFELLGLTGDVDLFIRPGSSLPSPNNFAYASTNLGTNEEFVAVAINSLPVPLSSGEWFVAVINQQTNVAVDYHLQMTEFVPGTPELLELTNAVPVRENRAGRHRRIQSPPGLLLVQRRVQRHLDRV